MSVTGLATGIIQIKDDTELTIATGTITITQGYHTLAAESGVTDDLDTINIASSVGSSGSTITYRPLLVVQAATGDTITIKHGTGNIQLNSGVDYALSGSKQIVLFYDGTNWTSLESSSITAADITSGTLAHERGGLEADVSAYAGVPLINGGATSEIKYNLAASTDPGATDDTGSGYVVGSLWVNTTKDRTWICVDNTTSAAVWNLVAGDISVEAFHNTTQSISASTNTILSWNSENFDTDDFHDTVTNNSRLTVPAGLGGRYLIMADIGFATGDGRKFIDLLVNGSTIVVRNEDTTGTTNVLYRRQITWEYDLVPADYAEVRVRQDDSGPASVNVDSSSKFYMRRVL